MAPDKRVSPWWRRGLATVGLSCLLGATVVAVTGSPAPADTPAFSSGQASALAQSFKINPTASALSVGFTFGQALAGYGGYRENFNSSHAYFDNLFLYYWLTGDESVVEMLRPIQERYRELEADRAGVQAILEKGADKAGEIASATLARAQRNIGLLPRA